MLVCYFYIMYVVLSLSVLCGGPFGCSVLNILVGICLQGGNLFGAKGFNIFLLVVGCVS